MEPHLPAPSLWLAGTTPIVGALAALGAATGWRVSVFDPIADADAFPDAERVLDRHRASGGSTRSSRPTSSSRPRGSGTRRRWPAALRRDVAYVGLVASPTRARGRARVAARRGRHPRGAARRAARPGRPRPGRRDARGDRALDPGRARPGSSRPGRVRRRAGPGDGRRRGSAEAAAPSRSPIVDDIVLLDPVCGMTVDRAHARHLAEHEGVVYAFCSMGCRTAFIKEPGAYVAVGQRRSIGCCRVRRGRRPTAARPLHHRGLIGPAGGLDAVSGHRRDRRAA